MSRVSSLWFSFRMLSRSRKIALGILLLIIAAIPLNLYIGSKRQDTQQHAGGSTTPVMISFDPSTTRVAPGSTQSIAVNIDPKGHQVSFVKLHITFDPTLIKNVKFTPNITNFPADFGPTPGVPTGSPPPASPPPITCAVAPNCPAPPAGCNYTNATSCSCGQLDCQSGSSGVAISSVNPSVSPVGGQVTITGSGFATDGANDIAVDKGNAGYIEGVSSTNGTTISLTIPDKISQGICMRLPDDPPNKVYCQAVAQQVPFPVGTHTLSVISKNGQSNDVSFTVTSAPIPSPTTCTTSPTCVNPPSGCSYVNATSCSCGQLVCATPTPTPMHCGGFMENPPTCPSGYTCQIDHALPDAGGTCVPLATTNSNASTTGSNVLGVSTSTSDITITVGIGSDPSKAITSISQIGTLTFTAASPTTIQSTTMQIAPDSQVLAIDAASAPNEDILDHSIVNGPTITIDPNAPSLRVSVNLEGLSAADLASHHPDRPINVKIYSAISAQSLVATKTGVMQVASGSATYTAAIDVSGIAPGSYEFFVNTPGFLQKRVIGVYQFPGQVTLPAVTLPAGDVNGDNVIDIKDYNILSACFDVSHSMSDPASNYSKPPCSTTFAANRANADLNKDGSINGLDYNLFITSVGSETGDIGGDVACPSPAPICTSPTVPAGCSFVPNPNSCTCTGQVVCSTPTPSLTPSPVPTCSPAPAGCYYATSSCQSLVCPQPTTPTPSQACPPGQFGCPSLPPGILQ